MSYEYKPIATPLDGSNELAHWGIKGQKWGVRRWQNEDGTLTPEGYIHYYGHGKPRHGAEKQTLKKVSDMSDEEINETIKKIRSKLSTSQMFKDEYMNKLWNEQDKRYRKKQVESDKKHPYTKKVLEDIAKKTGKTLDTVYELDRYVAKPTKEEADKDGGEIYKLLSNGRDPFMEKVSEKEFCSLLQKYYDRSVDIGDSTRTWYDPNKLYWRDFDAATENGATDEFTNTIFFQFSDHSISIDRDPDTGKLTFWGLEG